MYEYYKEDLSYYVVVHHQPMFMFPSFNIYTSSDIVHVVFKEKMEIHKNSFV